MTRLHDNEIPVDEVLVRELVDSQFPQFASLPIKPLNASGSSNIQYRLGNELLVRLPRQPGGGASIEKEHRWSEYMNVGLPVSVPEILHVGAAAPEYPEPWSILKWIDGHHPKSADGIDVARQLAEVLIAFRELEITPAAKADKSLRKPYRGRTLGEHDPWMRKSIKDCRAVEGLDIDLDVATGVWDEAMKLPGVSDPPPQETWFHGDIVAENLLIRDGQLVGLIDFGGLGIGDPTVDLHGAWELFTPEVRDVFRNHVGVDEATWLRGRAWALAIAMMTFAYYWKTMPERIESRLKMAQAVLADWN